MTYREYFNAVLNANISDEMNEVSVEFLSKLDSRNEKRKTVVTKDKAEAASRRDMVLGFLKENEGSFTRDEIAVAIGITPNQVTGACTTLVNEGKVNKTEVKVDKSRKVAYALA
jgi:Fic family protein